MKIYLFSVKMARMIQKLKKYKRECAEKRQAVQERDKNAGKTDTQKKELKGIDRRIQERKRWMLMEKKKQHYYNKVETKKYDGMAYKLLYILSRK